MTKRILSLLLCFMLIMGMVPTSVFAVSLEAETSQPELSVIDWDSLEDDSDTAMLFTTSNVAKISNAEGETEYATLAEAFDNVKTGDTVTLLDDVTLTEQINIKKALNGLIFDGNGKTVTLATTTDPSQSGGSGFYFGNANESLWCTGIFIKDLTIIGTARFAIFLCGGTTSTLENVNISGNYYYAVNLYGTHGATFTNCNISNSLDLGDDNEDGAAIWSNVAAANPVNLVNSNLGVIGINRYTTANTLAPKIFVDETSTVEVRSYDEGAVSGTPMLCVSPTSTGSYSVKTKNTDTNTWETVKVAKVSNTEGETAYESFAEAITAAGEGDTVTLLYDATTSDKVDIKKALRLDLNGKTITATNPGYSSKRRIDATAPITIKNGTLKNLYVQTTKDITMENVDITIVDNPTDTGATTYALYLLSGAINANLKNCNLSITTARGSASAPLSINWQAKNSVITMDGGSLTMVKNDGGGYAIGAIYATSSCEGVNITLNGVDVVYKDNSNTYTALNFSSKGGTLNINGGSVTATNIDGTESRKALCANYDTTATVNVYGGAVINGKIAIKRTGTSVTKINIKDATFTDEDFINVTHAEGNPSAILVVTGGKFAKSDANRKALTAAGVTFEENGEFFNGIDVSARMAKVEDTYYNNFAEAVTAANATASKEITIVGAVETDIATITGLVIKTEGASAKLSVNVASGSVKEQIASVFNAVTLENASLVELVCDTEVVASFGNVTVSNGAIISGAVSESSMAKVGYRYHPSTMNIAEGSGLIMDSTTSFGVLGQYKIAKFGAGTKYIIGVELEHDGVTYYRLYEKIDDAILFAANSDDATSQENETIKLFDNVSDIENYYSSGGTYYINNAGTSIEYATFTIDLNDKTWSSDYQSDNELVYMLAITANNTDITIKNGTITGTNATYGITTNGMFNNTDLTLEDLTINVPNGSGMYLPAGGNVTMTNVTINAKSVGVQTCAAAVTLNNCDITTQGDDRAAEKAGGDGLIADGSAVSIVNRPGYMATPSVVINGGSFTTGDTSGVAPVKAYDWNFTGTAGTQNNTEWTPAVKPAEITNTDVKVSTIGENEGEWVAIASSVAKIGDVEYQTIEEAVAALSNGDTLTLLGNIVTNDTIKFTTGTYTINLGGFSIRTPDVVGVKGSAEYVYSKNVIDLSGDANLTIVGPGVVKAGNITNSYKNGGDPKSIYVSNKAYTGTLTIDNATIEGADIYDARPKSYAIYTYGGTLIIKKSATIKGGTYNKTDTEYEGGNVYTSTNTSNANEALYAQSDVTINVSDSSIIGGTATAGAVAGIAMTCKNNCAVTITNSEIHGGDGVGEGGYGLSLGSGCTGSVTNSTITGGNSETFNAEKAVKTWGAIEFTGCTITGGDSLSTKKGTGIGGSAVYGVPAEGSSFVNCTITGGAGAGSYPGTAFEIMSSKATVSWQKDAVAHMNIKNCTVTSGSCNEELYTQTNQNYGSILWLYGSNSGTITFEDCELNLNSPTSKTNAVITGNYSTGSTVQVKGDLIVKNQGTPMTDVEKLNSANVMWIDENEKEIYKVALSSEGKINAAPVVAKVGTEYYESIEDAAAALTNGDTLTLLSDVDIDKVTANGGVNAIQIPAGITVTIDLNGNTMTKKGPMGNWGEVQTSAILNKGTLTITDSSTDKTGKLVGGGYNYCSGAVVKNYGTLYITGGRFESGAGTNGMDKSGHYVIFNLGEAYISDGEFFSDSIKTALIRNDKEMYISGGEFEQKDFLVLRNAGTTSVMEISGDTVVKLTNDRAMQNYGTVAINGGEFNGDIQTASYDDHAATTTITDGTVKGSIYTSKYKSDDYTGNIPTSSVAISGGTYSKPINHNFCAEGFVPSDDGSGNYGVKVGTVKVERGSEVLYFLSIEKAVKAAVKDSIVTILDDTVVSVNDITLLCSTGLMAEALETGKFKIIEIQAININITENVASKDEIKTATTVAGEEIADADKQAVEEIAATLDLNEAGANKLVAAEIVTEINKSEAVIKLEASNIINVDDTTGDITKVVDNTPATVTVVRETYLDIVITDYSYEDMTLAFEIKPMYNLKATIATDDETHTEDNTVVIENALDLTVDDNAPVDIKFTLPAGFVDETVIDRIFIKHTKKDGTVESYRPTLTKNDDGTYTASFTTLGFSPFELIVTDLNADVQYKTADGTNYGELKSYSHLNIGNALPTITDSTGKVFMGWKFERTEGINTITIPGTYFTLTDILMSNLNGHTWNAKPVFSGSYTITAEVADPDNDYNIGETITVNFYASSDDTNADFGSFGFKLVHDTTKLELTNVSQKLAGQFSFNNNKADAKYGTVGLVTESAQKLTSRVLLLTATYTVKAGVPTSLNEAIEITEQEMTPYGVVSFPEAPAVENAVVDIYNLKVTFATGANATFASTDATEAFAKYNEAGLYTSEDYTTEFTFPTPTANDGYRLADKVWESNGNFYTNDEIKAMSFEQDTTFTVATVKTYEISFGTPVNGNYDATPTTITADAGTVLDTLTLPTFTANTGYRFNAWNDGTNDIDLTTYTLTEDITITPIFVEQTFNWSYTQPAGVTMTDLTGITDHKVTFNTDVNFKLTEETGYIITSVSYTVGGGTAQILVANASGIYTIPGTEILGDIAVEVVLNRYVEITFTAGEGNTLTDTVLYAKHGLAGLYTDKACTITGTVPAPVVSTGYRLANDTAEEPLWVGNDSNEYTTAGVEAGIFTENVTLTAKSIKQYTVTFVSNDTAKADFDGETSFVLDTGASIETIPTVVYTAGYTFDKWVINSTDYATDDAIKALAITADTTVTLYAKDASFTITLDGGAVANFTDITGVVDGNVATHGTDVTFKLTVNTGYKVTVVSYQVGSDTPVEITPVGDVYTIPGDAITGNVAVILTSNETYTISFVAGNNGTVGGTTLFTLDKGTMLSDTQLAEVTKIGNPGYTFKEWQIGGVAKTDAEITGAAFDENTVVTAIFDHATYTVTMPAGMTNDGATVTEATHGTDLVITPVKAGSIVTGISYSVDGGTATVLTVNADGKSYTIPGNAITGNITITANEFEGTIEFITAMEYKALASGGLTQIAVLNTAKLTDSKYVFLNGTEFYWSSKYNAYVKIVDSTETAETISAKLRSVAGNATEVIYTGDLNGSGDVTAADAGAIEWILQQNANFIPTDLQRLACDVTGNKTVTVDDVAWVLGEFTGTNASANN